MSGEAKSAPHEAVAACMNEREAILASIALAGLRQCDLADRMRVSSQLISKWLKRGIPARRVAGLCAATGTLLLQQFLAHERALRIEAGLASEADRIARIAALAGYE